MIEVPRRKISGVTKSLNTLSRIELKTEWIWESPEGSWDREPSCSCERTIN